MINLEDYREVYDALEKETLALKLFKDLGLDVHGSDSKSVSNLALLIMLIARVKKLERYS